MMKKLFITLICLIAFWLWPTRVLAFEPQSFLSLVFPVRPLTPTLANPQTTLDFPLAIYQAATASGEPLTWLLQSDLLSDQETQEFFISLSQKPNQEIGLLLEVSPRLIQLAHVELARSSQLAPLLNSYYYLDRPKLIDAAMDRYFAIFGTYPKTVGAAYIDSYSLQYLRQRYGILAAIFDIPTASGYRPQLTGFSPYFPYFPSINNALIPAQQRATKIGITISHWNPPDFSGRSLPLYSTEKLLVFLEDWSLKDLNEFNYLAFGLDNQTSVAGYLPIFKSTLQLIKEQREDLTLRPVTADKFGLWFNQRYPLTAPAYHYRSGNTIYYANPFYQVGLQENRITSLTVFNARESETFRFDRNLGDHLTLTTYPLITPDQPLSLDLDLSSASFSSEYWDLIIQSSDKTLRFNAKDIFANFPLHLPVHPALTQSSNGYRINFSWLPFATPPLKFIFDTFKIFLPLLALAIYFKFRLPPLSITLTLIFGSLAWLLTTIRSGSLTQFGLSFWGAHSHDSLVHLSLIESFKQSLWPLNNPTLAGTMVTNYHILYDYLLALVSRFLDISPLDLYFRFIPPLLALSIGYLSYRLLSRWRFSATETVISLLGLYFLGSLGFLKGGEAVFWAQQNISTLINPPYAFSLVLLLLFLNYFTPRPSLKRLVSLSILAALLIQTKAYAAILLTLSLFVYLLIHRQRRVIYLFLLTLGLSFLLMLPTYQAGSFPFIFQPFWFIRTMIASPDRLNWVKAASAWLNYQAGGQYLKLLPLHLVGLILFFGGNLGLRLLSLPSWFKSFRSTPSRELVAWLTLFSLTLPLVIIQSGNSWNTIQFFYYGLFFLSLFIGPSIVSILARSHILPKFLALVSTFILFGAGSTIITFKEFLSARPSAAVTYEELRALDTLSRQPAGTVVAPGYLLDLARPFSDPKPLFAADTNAYLSALSRQPSYLSDEINLIITGADFQERKKNNQRFYLSADPRFASSFLQENQIKYVYQNPLGKLQLPPAKLEIEPIFSSGYYQVYRLP